MCGIFGYIGEVDQGLAGHCLDRLAHRGPDGRGLVRLDGATLGHRRLSILDLSEQGVQPMSYADGRYWITYNGEIYNFLELRAELEGKGYRFSSRTDTEVVLAAFVAWGERCLERFNGMWAFAIWDARERALFMSRDRLGKKPLFYAEVTRPHPHRPPLEGEGGQEPPLPTGEGGGEGAAHGDGPLPSTASLGPAGCAGAFSFASEMKALFPLLPEVSANETLVRDFSRIFHYESTDACVVNGIKRFPAGHYGWLKDGRLTLGRWWRTLDHLVQVPARYEEQVERFRELFLDACRLRMRSDVPIGTALSGGLDSSATICSMAHLASRGGGERMGESWQHAFIAAFPGTPLDETRYARAVTDHIGIDATVLKIDPLKALDDLDRYHYLFEEFFISSPIPFMQTYRAVKDRGISVTLDGHGADELFGGYEFDLLVALGDAGLNPRSVREVLDAYYDSFPPDTDQFGKLPSRARLATEWHARRMARSLIDRLKGEGSREEGHSEWKRLDHLTRRLYLSTHRTVLPTLLRNYDRYSMASGVEIRMPFLDHRILTFAFSLPWNSKIRGGFSKAVVRDAMAPFMPRDIAYRKAKMGFNAPLLEWMKGPLKEFLMDTIASRSFSDCSLIDAEAVSRRIVKVIDDPQANFNDGQVAWMHLAPYLWERAVIGRGGTACA